MTGWEKAREGDFHYLLEHLAEDARRKRTLRVSQEAGQGFQAVYEL